MTMGRWILLLFVLMNQFISSVGAGYQQPQRPPRAEIERARKEGKVPPDPSDARNIQEAIKAANAYFHKYFRDDCGQSGDWVSKGYMPGYADELVNVIYKPKYWFRQYRGLQGFKTYDMRKADPATTANDPTIDLITDVYIKADTYRSFIYPIVQTGRAKELNYKAGRWTSWQQGGDMMEFTLIRKGGVWVVKGKIQFQFDSTYGDGPRDYSKSDMDISLNYRRETTVQWLRPDCSELPRQ